MELLYINDVVRANITYGSASCSSPVHVIKHTRTHSLVASYCLQMTKKLPSNA